VHIFRKKLCTKVGDYLYGETNHMYHLRGDMNLTYMCVYMYVNKMVYSGSTKMAANYVTIDGHHFLIFLDGSED